MRGRMAYMDSRSAVGRLLSWACLEASVCHAMALARRLLGLVRSVLPVGT